MKRILALLALIAAIAAPARATTYTLTISTSGPVSASSTITSSPTGISCPGSCVGTFYSTTTVILTEVNPSTMSFTGWGAPCNSNQSTCSLILPSNTVLTAAFSPHLDLSFSGIGIGNVAVSTGPACSNSGGCANGAVATYVYAKGTTIVLTESTGTASAFVGWSGDGGCSRASTCTVTLNGYEHIIATFTVTGSVFPMAVSVIPTKGGYVTSSPAGIATASGVYGSTFTANASVAFSTAAASGYRFAGWGNAGCAGLTPCVVVSTSPLQGLGGNFSPAAYFYKVNQ